MNIFHKQEEWNILSITKMKILVKGTMGSNYWNHVTLHLLIILKFQLYKYIILHYSLRTQLHHEWIHNLIFRPRKSQSSIMQVSCFKSVVWRVLSYVGELCTDLFFYFDAD
jgi:hypothetical protein